MRGSIDVSVCDRPSGWRGEAGATEEANGTGDGDGTGEAGDRAGAGEAGRAGDRAGTGEALFLGSRGAGVSGPDGASLSVELWDRNRLCSLPDPPCNLAAISPFSLSQLVVSLTNDVRRSPNGRKHLTKGFYFAAKRVIRNQSVIVI